MAQTEVTANAPVAAPVPTGPATSTRIRVRDWGERVGVVLIVLGIFGLIQPWVQSFFTNGFTVLLIGTLIFIVASHL